MPLVYTKEEIKAYLAERGFDTSNEEMINQFVRDLKKMVKYEDRRRRRMQLGHDPQETNLDSTGQSGPGPIPPDNKELCTQGSSTNRRGQEVVGSSAGPSSQIPGRSSMDESRLNQDVLDTKNKSNGKRDRPQTANLENDRKGHNAQYSVDSKVPAAPGKVIMTRKTYKQQNGEAVIEESIVHVGESSEQQQRPKTALGLHRNIAKQPNKPSVLAESNEECSGSKSRSQRFISNSQKVSRSGNLSSQLSRIVNNCNPEETEELLLILGSLLGECDDEDLETQSVTTNRTIRGPPDSIKRDPVALYHYYKNIWDKQSIPGQGRHMQLRWNVRAQTVGNYPCVDGRPVKYLR